MTLGPCKLHGGCEYLQDHCDAVCEECCIDGRKCVPRKSIAELAVPLEVEVKAGQWDFGEFVMRRA